MEIKEMWNIARDACCDRCSQARGCNTPCQYLRNHVSQMTKGMKPSVAERVTEEDVVYKISD
jgi:hypothetical protein